MTIESVTNSYASKIEILQFPDDYVARPQFFDEQSKLAVKEEGRFICDLLFSYIIPENSRGSPYGNRLILFTYTILP